MPETETESAEAVIETSEPATTILVFKVRPSRLALTYRDKIEKALALYAGELDATEGDDIVIYFDKSDQLFQAICSGLLVLEIFNQANSPITIKAGMHQVSDSQVATDFETAKKHATYLASITEKQLLTSRHVREIISLSDQYEIQPFHSSMTPDGEVFCIDALLDQDLIDEQVNYLAKQD